MADNAIANDAEILAGFAEIVKEVTAGVVKDGVTADMSFVEDLDMDSLSMVEIAVQAEEKFGVKIPDDELPNLKTVGDAVNYVSTNTNLEAPAIDVGLTWSLVDRQARA